jgi:hypothetical protein
MSSSELERLREIVPGLQIHYSLQGAELCGDFQEDLQFHFSLGLNTLSVLPPSSSPSLLHLSLTIIVGCGIHGVMACCAKVQTFSSPVSGVCGVRSTCCSPCNCSTAPEVSPLALPAASDVCVWRIVQLRVAGLDPSQQGSGSQEAVCPAHEGEGAAPGQDHQQQL